MQQRKVGTIIAAVIGVLFLIVAIIYWTQPAGSLPGFLPGHEAGVTAKHIKHGLLALALAIIAFLVAWFQSGPRSDTT